MAAQQTREQVSVDLTWDLSQIYASQGEWEDDFGRVEAALGPLAAYRGRLGEGAVTLLAFLRARDTAAERLEKVVAYARLAAAADGRSAANQARAARAGALTARAGAAVAFAATELSALPERTIERFLSDEAALGPFRPQLERIVRRRAYVLTPQTEEALAALSETIGLAETIWGRATATDLACPPIEDGAGRSAPVTIARYVFEYAHAPDRAVRRRAYESLAAGLDRFKNTLATTLGGHIQRNVVLARLRGYPSAVAMILDRQEVTEPVYRQVLAEVHDGMLPHVRRLVALRQRVLGIDRVHRYDLEAPLDPTFDPPTTFAESRTLIRAGLAVLGETYGEIVEAAFRDRWVDRADNLGKRSGAFGAPIHGAHSYILTTWSDRLRNALILAHELGHAGHQVLANRRQIISNGFGYWSTALTGATMGLFFVEGPSTCNELLVGRHILDTTDDPRLRRYVIMQFLGTFTHNMVTHMLEAHFEQRLYDLAEAGQPITTPVVLDTQAAVFERFYGDSVAIDDGARLYWAQQPHFYYGLYPYTYAAGVACAYNVVQDIQQEGQPAVERWLGVLEAGGTLPAPELARRAGVDMTSPEPLRRAVAYFSWLVDELEASFA